MKTEDLEFQIEGKRVSKVRKHSSARQNFRIWKYGV